MEGNTKAEVAVKIQETEIDKFFESMNNELDKLNSINHGFSILASRSFGAQPEEVMSDRAEPSNICERLIDISSRLAQAVIDNEIHLQRLQRLI